MSVIKWALLFAVLPTGCEAGDDGDDFSNNLFTDLAPLLALFGERVTMAFMSQSLGWLDNIILSMVPLGIITVIVSAIRVGGPSWLKAIIGRGRENLAVAEAELMSSTSKEVCELWNGHEVVRCMGTAPITEFICLLAPNIRRGQNPKIEIIDVEQAIHKGYLDLEGEPAPLRRLWSRLPTPEPTVQRGHDTFLSNISYNVTAEEGQATSRSSEPEIVIARNTQADGPNLSLNCHHELRREELLFFAMAGIILQVLVIWYSCWATFHLRFKKGGLEVADYALPCTVSGTGLLVVGLLLCSHVVESSTEEQRFRAGQGRKARMIWLQKTKTVSEQDFASSAIFGEGERIITSRRRGTQGHDTTLATKTVSGTLISICGFVIQFVGLRGMHWSVSVVQLGAVFVMTGARAWVRRGLARPPRCQPLPPEFELDWFAMTLGYVGDAPWRRLSTTKDKEDWCIESPRTQGTQPEFHDPDQATSRAHDIMMIRRDLAHLADWRGSASAEAICVAKAIEITMDTLFESYGQAFSWSLMTQNNQYIDFRLERRNGKWKAYSDEIEAALSLWLFAVHQAEHEENYRGDHCTRVFDPRDDEWLRAKGQPAARSLRLLGPYSQALHRDLWWWLPAGTTSVMRMEEVYLGGGSTEWTGKEKKEEMTWGKVDREPGGMGKHRIVGHVPSHHSASQSWGNQWPGNQWPGNQWPEKKVKYRFRELTEPNFESSDRCVDESDQSDTHLVAESTCSLKSLYAQDIFSAFMWAAAKATTGPIGDSAEILPGVGSGINGWRSFTLSSPRLSKLTRDVQGTGLGSLEDIYLSMIPPLSAQHKLSQAGAIVELAREHAGRDEEMQNWGKATDTYIWLYQTAKTFPKKSGIAIKATAVLMGHLRKITEAVELAKGQRLDHKYIEDLEKLELSLVEEVRSADSRTVLSILKLSEEEGRPWSIGPWLEAHSNEPKISDDYLRTCNETELHRLARENRKSEEIGKILRQADASPKNIHDWTPLHYAASKGAIHSVRTLLEHRADANAKDLRGWTPLHYACQQGFDQVALTLRHQGGSLRVRGRDGVAPLHCATMNNHTNVVGILVDAGAAIDVADAAGNTPLHWALYKGHEDVARYLWQSANKRLRNNYGRTALHFAAVAGMLDVLSLSDAKGSVDIDAKDVDGWTPLHFAAEDGHESSVRLLLELGANTEAGARWNRQQPLDVGEKHSERGTHVNILLKGLTPLHFAAKNGYDQVARLLLERGASRESKATYKKKTPLHFATENGHELVTRCLIEFGADIAAQTRRGDTPLHFAALSGQPPVLRLLLESGANIDARNLRGVTPLLRAVFQACELAVRMLIEAGALITVKDASNNTPLHEAARGRNEAVARLLIESAGADIVQATDMSGKTPLHRAATSGSEPVAKLLIEFGADLESRDDQGHTALHCAAIVGCGLVTELLLASGAEKEVEDNAGHTPLYYATECGHDGVAKLLR